MFVLIKKGALTLNAGMSYVEESYYITLYMLISEKNSPQVYSLLYDKSSGLKKMRYRLQKGEC